MKVYQSTILNRIADNLYRSGEGTYYARFKLHGKNFKKSLKTHDRKKADRELADLIRKIEQKEVERTDIHFEVLADEWLASIKPRLKKSSYVRRISSLNSLRPFFKGRMVRTITHEHLQAWEASRTNISGRTFNVDRETLRIIFEYAVYPKGILTKNLIDKRSMPKRKEMKAVITPPTREQFIQMLEIIRLNQYTRGAVEYIQFMAFTGLRLEEVNNVQWRDVDFAKGLLTVTGGETGTKNHSQRSIPLFAPAGALLEKIKETSEVVPTATIFKQKSARSAMRTACLAMGIEEKHCFTHHDLRHFFCSNALEKNVPDHVIASWLGHKDGGILVRKTYGHLRQSHSLEMAKLMDFAG